MLAEDTINTSLYFYNNIKPKFITSAFFSKYLNLEPPFGDLGLIVFLRTYSRYLPYLGRREYWCETVLRVVEYSLSLYTGKASQSELVTEAESLYNNIFNLRVFPAGRTLWIGNTEVSKQEPSANFNCCFCTINSLSKFSEIFYWLLLGSGVGFSVENKYVSQLPKLNTDFSIEFKPYEFVKKTFRESDTVISLTDSNFINSTYLVKKDLIDNNFIAFKNLFFFEAFKPELLIYVGDSKTGWCTALKTLLYALTCTSIKKITVNFDNVRPAGTPLKTMGGRASGPQALEKIFSKICTTVKNSEGGELSAVNCLDICNFIAEGVVCGGVRRSSQISLGDLQNTEFVTAKYNLWTDPEKEYYRSTRVMSNNSVCLYKNPGLEKMKELMQPIKSNGEPGLINFETMQLRAPNRLGLNPCCEITLDNDQSCNLTEVNLLSFVDKNGNLDIPEFCTALKQATRMGSRITTVTQWHPDWDEKQKRDRLLGVSITGIVEAFDKMKWQYKLDADGNYSYTNDFRATALFKSARAIVRAEMEEYHKELGIPPSLLTTCIKPSGTLSQLPTVSSGLHRPYAPYFIRRIRVSRQDPIAHALKGLEVPVVPENNQGNDLYGEECDTWVFSFVVKTNAPIRAIDERAVDQLERYKQAMEHYVEHNVSYTVSVAENEWDEVAEWLVKPDNWKVFVGVSFLPRFDAGAGESPYPNLPYETITEAQYAELKNKMPVLTEKELVSLISSYETDYEEFSVEFECATGGCPVK